MKSLAIIFATITVSVSALILPVKAEMLCQVTDPTGSPLNVRDTPNGRVINALKNGREVYIHEVAYDNQGRPWVNVGGYYQDEYRIWGWVFREFISCYER